MIAYEKPVYLEEQSADGLLEVYFSDPPNGDFIIGFKHIPPESFEYDEPFTTKLKIALREKMEKTAVNVLNQIDMEKYTAKFKGAGGKIYKVAVVTARLCEVLVKFAEKENLSV
jgi:hypothetical protein